MPNITHNDLINWRMLSKLLTDDERKIRFGKPNTLASAELRDLVNRWYKKHKKSFPQTIAGEKAKKAPDKWREIKKIPEKAYRIYFSDGLWKLDDLFFTEKYNPNKQKWEFREYYAIKSAERYLKMEIKLVKKIVRPVGALLDKLPFGFEEFEPKLFKSPHVPMIVAKIWKNKKWQYFGFEDVKDAREAIFSYI